MMCRALTHAPGLREIVLSAEQMIAFLRQHAFSHFPASKRDDLEEEKTSLPLDMVAVDKLLTHPALNDTQTEVNVVSEEGKSEAKAEVFSNVELSEAKLSSIQFVRETAAQIGVKFQAEEVLPGAFYPSTEDVLLKVRLSFTFLLLKLGL